MNVVFGVLQLSDDSSFATNVIPLQATLNDLFFVGIAIA
jgi:hypothetical protein